MSKDYLGPNVNKPTTLPSPLPQPSESESLRKQVALLREALALHHSMVMGGEKESPASEACYRIAMESSK